MCDLPVHVPQVLMIRCKGARAPEPEVVTPKEVPL